MKKVKVYKFSFTDAADSFGWSTFRLFVAKADYDRALKRIKELEAKTELEEC